VSVSPATPLGRGMGQPLGRANISNALLNLLATAYPWANTPSLTAELPENVAAANMPALYVVIPQERSTQGQAFGLNTYERKYGALVYCKRDTVRGAQVFFSPFIEGILDSIDLCLRQGPIRLNGQTTNPPGSNQTLGGLVTNCWYDGVAKLINASTNVGQFAALTIPITVLVAN
jgi:hypothetical protein